MKTIICAFTLALLMSTGSAWADAKKDCEAKAVDKNGKPLAGAAKDASVKKCMKEAGGATASKGKADCEAKAVDKNGKPLAGAAKESSIKKCMADAKKG